jgi:L-aspartate oxidase
VIIKSAVARKESRGLHFTTDYPVHAAELTDTIF